MAALLVLLGAIVVGLGIAAQVKPLPRLGLGTSKRGWIAIGGGVVLMFLAAGLSGPTTSSSQTRVGAPAEASKSKATASRAAKKRPPLSEANKDIRSVEPGGPNLWIDLKIEDYWNEIQAIDRVALAVRDVGRAVQAGASELETSHTIVPVRVHVAGTDRLGNDTEIDVANIYFHADDLRKARFDNLTFARVLDLAYDVEVNSRVGMTALLAWCGDDDNASEAASFCAKVLAA